MPLFLVNPTGSIITQQGDRVTLWLNEGGSMPTFDTMKDRLTRMWNDVAVKLANACRGQAKIYWRKHSQYLWIDCPTETLMDVQAHLGRILDCDPARSWLCFWDEQSPIYRAEYDRLDGPEKQGLPKALAAFIPKDKRFQWVDPRDIFPDMGEEVVL